MMDFEESPSISDFKNGLPDSLPSPNQPRKKFRLTLMGLIVIVLMLGVFTLIHDRGEDIFRGVGAVQGAVTDDRGAAFQGEVLILGTDLLTRTDENGRFLLKNVPAGQQALIVMDQVVGYEYAIAVLPGETFDVGTIQFRSRATP